ncbi:fatty-acid oxidation protein subunit alpha [Pigmentiphaga sp. H8]|uniref:3-hydroxyacyl-CoA dehydrogenase NAD-binding domain-containing protein n=1 Tax=Pigmentiphaga sp. H8 TaxID=2488560 RepID=UPI000F5A22A2|nr:3-hydroxyacyl-CoA dehydrogenase NAD-binding domain-containing protein [Pigmentiphaga sp. H8]AZG08273.1 fatty-acid oxidation protein subunit alpha [Pigmentiphaga sp. H8]
MNDEVVSYEIRDRVGIITLRNPPVNALAPGVREGIIDFVKAANEDPVVDAIVLTGAGRNFMAGADIRQFGKARAVTTRASAGAIEASEKPVVAAMDGYCLGGGLEHALACHYRIATPAARLGLPEIKLGIIPAGGGTQRLPRLVGAEAALDLILSGRQVGADEALALGLIDEIAAGDLVEFAAGVARRIASGRPLRRTSLLTAWQDADREKPEIIEAARKTAARRKSPLKAPGYAIELVAASLHADFGPGLELEHDRFSELEHSDESKALRYAFFAEKTAGKIPGIATPAAGDKVRRAAVVGGGTMGSGIAIAFADVGIPVKMLEATPEALERAMERIRSTYETRVQRKSLTPDQMRERMARIEPVSRYESIGDCDAVIEAVFERIDLKVDIFGKLDVVMKPDALLLTNSSAIDINVMARATKRPGSVAGAHFFAPANVMKLCEIVAGDATSIDTLGRATAMGKALGKISVVAGSCDGFAANRSRAPLVTEMMLLLEEGALPWQIDKVMMDFGYPMGPFAVSDLSGLDVSYDTRKRRAAADPTYRKLHVPDRLVEMGRYGQKNGTGWYRYEKNDRTPRPDAVVSQVIADIAREFDIPQREFTDEEILHRLLFASVNEACKIIDEGKSFRASDIDAMWLNGFGFPRHRGGLMYWADGVGAPVVLREVQAWHDRYGKRWKPSPLLARIVAQDGRLRDAAAPDTGTLPSLVRQPSTPGTTK